MLAGGVLVTSLVLLSNCSAADKTGPPPVATQLAFKIDPSTSPAGGVIPPVTVQARDASGKLVSGFSDSVTVTLAVNPTNGVLLGTRTVAAVGGVATFTNLSLQTAGTGYRLQAASGGLTPTLSAKFDIMPGPATHLGFTAQPGTSVAGTAIAPAVKVTALDALENAATGFSGSITVAISSGTGASGAALSGITTANSSAGVATFSTLSIDKMGIGYRLAASSASLSPVTSDSFDIVAGAAAQLVFITPPATTTAGTIIAPPIQVEVRDAVGNPVTGFPGNVTVSITTGSGTSGATLAGTRTVLVSGGIATFSDLSINRSGTAYTIAARSSGLAGATSGPFDILPGPVAALAFSAQPQTSTAGATLPAVAVTAQDASGNIVPSFADPVALSISANPGNGTLHGSTTQAAVNGVATFADLSIDSVGIGYRLQASAGALSATSQAFSIRPGNASRLVFTVQPPGTTVAGAAIAPAVQVSQLDSLGNIVTAFTGAVTVALTAGKGTAGATLSGTATVNAVAGVASFTTLSIDSVGTGYTLTATTDGLPDTVSAAFSIIPGAAARLEYTVQPTAVTAGEVFAPPIAVTARDALGNIATGFIANVTISITTGTGASGANLAGTKTVAAAAGVATFNDLSIDQAGSGYTLSARSSGITGAVSDPFDILIGSVTRIVFTQQPTTDTAGVSITPAVQITAQDGSGNTVTGFTGTVTVSIVVNPGGGTLSGTKSLAAVAGVATFPGLSIDKAGTGYRLQAAAGTLKDTSQAFSILAGTATKLAFTQQPTNATAGLSISPSVKVAGQDAFGNTSTAFTGDVTVAIGTNPSGGQLSGTLTLAAVSGVATFSNLSIDKAGTGYTLKATATGLTTATSTSFNITTGAATQLAFTVQPVTTAAGATIPTVKVTARDASGNTVTAYTGNVTMAIGNDPGNGTLSGTVVVTAVQGVATFSNLSINRSGTGYTLKASATGLTTAFSTPFDILPGAAAVLAFGPQPVSTTATTTLAPIKVTAQDAQGNTATGFTGNVTVAIAVNPGGGTLSGTKTVAAVAGVATFSTLSIDKAGTGYRLAATASGLTPDTSAAFSITAGPAANLVFTVQPTTTEATATITPAVKVAAQDVAGNTVTSFTGSVTIAIGTNPSSGILSGTKTVTAVAGVATYSDLSIDKLGTGYTLRATSTGLTAATSTAFNIVAGTATQLAFTTQPVTTAAGATIPTVKVTARDGSGNTVTTYTGNVTMAIGTDPGNGTLSGTLTVTAVQGVATFSNLSINRSGTGYTLKASATGLTTAFSTPFDILPGAAAVLAFGPQPVSTTATTTLAPIKVTAQDALGNAATGFTGNVTVAIAVNPGGGTLSGTKTVAAVAGVATFSTLSIDKVGTGYRLAATATGLTPDTSSAFSITAGTAATLTFTVQPTQAGAGAIITPAVKVAALDAGGNTATGFAGNVTVAMGTNPSGGILSGTKTVAAVAGVATFSDLSIDKLGTGYTLTAAATGLTSATSATFNIVVGTATQLAFTTQPTNTTAGATMATVRVTARDAQGNTATGYTGNVTVAIGTNPGGGTLSGTKTVAAVAGVATFSSLTIDKSGTGYTLTAAANNLAGATSSTFNITAAALSQLGFLVEPVNTVAGATITPAVKVAGQDAFGNTVTSFTGSVTIAITPGSGTAGATLSGTKTVNASAGVATFSTLSIDKTGADYHLTASSGVLTPATSAIFAITAGTATHLTFEQQPTSTVAGVAIAPAVTVSARDALGNPVKTFAGSVTVAIAAGTGAAGATLSGTKVVTASGPDGLATFSTLSINKAATGYRLVATATGLTADTSTAFTITAGAATKLAFTVQPVAALAGAVITPAVEVTAQDALGNTVTGFTGSVAIAITSGTGTAGAVLSGTTPVVAVAGVATFSDLSINLAGTGYKLTATTSGLTSATSGAFPIN